MPRLLGLFADGSDSDSGDSDSGGSDSGSLGSSDDTSSFFLSSPDDSDSDSSGSGRRRRRGVGTLVAQPGLQPDGTPIAPNDYGDIPNR